MKTAAAWLALGCAVLFAAMPSAANNIVVTNIGLFKYDTNQLTANVYFDLAWDNSWRDADNRDAAWVFVKFRSQGSSVWDHAILSANSADHRPAAGSVIDAVSDGMGVFVYSSANQTGSVSYVRTRLCWNYGSNGYNFAMGAPVELSVHAIEMVYIPAGPFCLGSGGTELGHFYKYPTATDPFVVSNETDQIIVGNTNNYIFYDKVTSPNSGDATGIISNAFPKGYAAFYCMKYEITQGQFADFLNKLTANQSGNNFPNKNGSDRNTIARVATNSYTASVPDRACNWMSCLMWVAYADWSGLRPMTELEYEKACRGAGRPISNEYAWGSTVITGMTAEAGTAGSGTETPSPTTANTLYSASVAGPVRVGIFAARTNATRDLSGAGYYGVMNLGDNVFERCVTVGHSIGRGFTGQHGNGLLNASGYADVTGWPPVSPDTTGLGSGLRGNSYQTSYLYSRTSARDLATYLDVGYVVYAGGRCVRTVP